MHEALYGIKNCCNKNKLHINASKIKEMLISFAKNKLDVPLREKTITQNNNESTT